MTEAEMILGCGVFCFLCCIVAGLLTLVLVNAGLLRVLMDDSGRHFTQMSA